METNHTQKQTTTYPAPLSGAKGLRTLDEFTKLCQSEFTVRHNAMVEEYKGRKHNLQLICDRKIEEYKFHQPDYSGKRAAKHNCSNAVRNTACTAQF